MPNDDQERNEAEALREICCSILPAPMPEPLVGQVVRVLMAKLEATETAKIVDPAGLFRAFVSLRLLSPRLLFLFGMRPDEGERRTGASVEMPWISPSMAGLLEGTMADLASAEIAGQPWSSDSLGQGLAVCFAASAYPQRVSQMINTTLAWRVEAWLGEFLRLRRSKSAPPAATRLPAVVNSKALFEALGAAGPKHPDNDLRVAGAALYLASCYTAETTRIVEAWKTEGEFLRFFRERLATSPSWTVAEDRSDKLWPDWDRVRSRFVAMWPGEPLELINQAIILEQMTWNVSKRYRAPRMLMQSVQEVWEHLWQKVVSGFPYYAFRSRFTWWWKQCVCRWLQKPARVLADSKKISNEPTAKPREDLTPETLRCIREGYRLVRSTFYPLRKGMSTDKVRKVVDDIFRCRIHYQIVDDASEQKMCKEIADQHNCRDETVSTYARRLRLKTSAHQLARLERCSNEEIQEECPSVSDAPGWELIANLGRAVPPEHTLLWAFGAHVFVHGLLDPQHPDPWTDSLAVRELWHWVNDGTFEDAVRQGHRDGSRIDRHVWEAMAASPFQRLLRDLRGWTDAEEAAEYVNQAKSECRWTEWVQAARKVLGSCAGPGLLNACAKTSFQQWKKFALGKRATHWIAAVWYLTVFEQLDDKQFWLRCQPGRDGPWLEELRDAIVERLRQPVASASVPAGCPAVVSAKGRDTP